MVIVYFVLIFVYLNYKIYFVRVNENKIMVILGIVYLQEQHILIFFYQLHAVYSVNVINSRLDRGNLVLRHSVPHFPSNFGDVEWGNSTSRFAPIPERKNENINLNKYITSSSGDRTHKLRLQ